MLFRSENVTRQESTIATVPNGETGELKLKSAMIFMFPVLSLSKGTLTRNSFGSMLSPPLVIWVLTTVVPRQSKLKEVLADPNLERKATSMGV